MSAGGDRPHDPCCALGRVIGEHDEAEYRRRLWVAYRVLVVNINDPSLSVAERNGMIEVGNRIFGEQPHGA